MDGIEHIILDGAKSYLNDLKIKSVLVEINENFKDQFEKVLKIMSESNFKILYKKQNTKILSKNSKFNNTFNYFFVR